MFSHAKEDALASGTPLPYNSNVPDAGYPLLRLWREFGLRADLSYLQWRELLPLLQRLPDIFKLANPRIDPGTAERVIHGCFRQHGPVPRPVRWFADARTALAYDCLVADLARPAFPAIDCCPRAISNAWFTATRQKRAEQTNAAWAGKQLRSFELWRAEKKNARPSARETRKDTQGEEIRSLAALIELFMAGVFYYWVKPTEVVCVARPSLWLEKGDLHRSDGPAVEWPTGERHYFWRGREMPKWVIESPAHITKERIRLVRSPAARRCMMERLGMGRFTLLEHWQEWQQCTSREDFEPFVDCGLHHAFNAVSRCIAAYAEAKRLTPAALLSPVIDRPAAEHAVQQFLRAWGMRERRLQWFETARSAQSFIARRRSSHPLRPAYWPRLGIAPLLDTVWYRRALSWNWPDEDWQDWTITAPRARECSPQLISRRAARNCNWRAAISAVGNEHSPSTPIQVCLSDPVIGRWTPLVDAFTAGLFYYWIGADEIVCVPRPAIWTDHDRLNREDGPAIEWPGGERYYFRRGVEVPNWIFERPQTITASMIFAELNVEIRRCMMERFGFGRFLRESGSSLLAQDAHGKLWRTRIGQQGHAQSETVLEVRNGTREPDGTYRQYFLSVPPDMRSATEAVAWTYGLSSEQYDLAVRT
jgi:hypothetical protein